MVRFYFNLNKKKIFVFFFVKLSYSIGDMNYIKNFRVKILGYELGKLRKRVKKFFLFCVYRYRIRMI